MKIDEIALEEMTSRTGIEPSLIREAVGVQDVAADEAALNEAMDAPAHSGHHAYLGVYRNNIYIPGKREIALAAIRRIAVYFQSEEV